MWIRTAAIALAASAWATLALAQAAAPEPLCVLAGRVTDANSPQARWAPRSEDVQLLDAQGRDITSAKPADLQRATQVRVQRDALASACVGNAALPRAADTEAPGTRADVPLIRASTAPLPIVALAMPSGRSGNWVEIKLAPPQERVVVGQRR